MFDLGSFLLGVAVLMIIEIALILFICYCVGIAYEG